MNSCLRKSHAFFIQHGHSLCPVHIERRRSSEMFMLFFRLEFNAVRNEYRYFEDNQNLIGGRLSQLRRSVDSIAVSTAECERGFSTVECERGFSTMNNVCSSTRTRLLVIHVSSLMFIKLIVLPIPLWKPEKYVSRWFSTRRSADSTACLEIKEHDYNNQGYKHLRKALLSYIGRHTVDNVLQVTSLKCLCFVWQRQI